MLGSPNWRVSAKPISKLFPWKENCFWTPVDHRNMIQSGYGSKGRHWKKVGEYCETTDTCCSTKAPGFKGKKSYTIRHFSEIGQRAKTKGCQVETKNQLIITNWLCAHLTRTKQLPCWIRPRSISPACISTAANQMPLAMLKWQHNVVVAAILCSQFSVYSQVLHPMFLAGLLKFQTGPV